MGISPFFTNGEIKIQGGYGRLPEIWSLKIPLIHDVHVASPIKRWGSVCPSLNLG